MALIHGDNTVFENTVTAMKGLMDNLKTAMDSAGDDPRPSAIYDTHNRHSVAFPSISVGIYSASVLESEAGIGNAGEIALPMRITCEIRIHLDYENGYMDKVKFWRLANSVMNYLTTDMNGYFKVNLVGYKAPIYEDMEFSSDEYFEESLTLGGYIRIGLLVVFSHAQN